MSLIDIELKSSWLENQLKRPISVHLKLLSICRFFSLFMDEENQSKYTSFYLQFKDQVFDLIKKNQFEYFSPDEIKNIKVICIKIFTLFPQYNDEYKRNILNILDEAKERILNILNDKIVEEQTEGNSFAINHVLIESDDSAHLRSGIVEKLIIDINKNGSNETGDKILFDGIIDNNADELHEELEKILGFVKKDVEEIIKKKEYAYHGTSMGTGAAVLIYNSILRSQLFKTYYKFREDVVLGTAIDESGKLIPLDPESLKIKLRTIFYSQYKKFVLPEENIIDARSELEKYNAQYPNRKLELIPIRHYLQTFKNLDIVEVCKLKIREKIKVNYNKYHVIANSILSLVILAILAVLTFYFVIPYLDRNPVYANKRNDHFIAYNKYGKEVWESEVLNPYEISEERLISKRIVVADLDNDHKNEIIYLRRDHDQRKMSKTIFCYNADNKLKWKTIIMPKDSIYGNEPCDDYLDLKTLYVSENKTNKQKEIITTYTICDQFPYFISKIDPKGKEISSFYNPGHLHEGELIDIDNDGEKEFVIGGQNNDYDKSGCLIVFDLDFIKGMAPGYRFPRGFEKGLMKYYVLFPKTLFTKFSSQRTGTIHTFTKIQGKIELVLWENSNYINIEKQEEHYRLLLTFDDKFNFLHLSTSTEFDVFYKMLIEEKKISPIKDWKTFGDTFRSQIRYWDGDKFVNYPTMNKYYVSARDSLNKQTKK